MLAGSWFDPAKAAGVPHDRLIAAIAARPVVLLGETHTNPRHHRWQLHTVAALHGRNPNMVLGFEAFPRRVQPALDRWMRGDLSEQAFLDQTEWNQVWKFDSELYMELFRFARLYRIPMVALNVDRELVSRVRKEGWQSIPGDQRQGVDDPAPAGEDYLDYLLGVFAEHRKEMTRHMQTSPEPVARDDPEFRRFVEAQLIWDRAMAQVLAGVRDGGGEPLVVGIVGQGHLQYGYGIPRQLADLGIAGSAVLLPWDAGRPCGELAPPGGPAIAEAVFGLAADAVSAKPPKLLLGVMIEDGEDGVRVMRVMKNSVAEASGLAEDDLIVEAAGRPIANTGDLIAVVGRQAPGTWLPLRLRRGEETLEMVAKFPSRP